MSADAPHAKRWLLTALETSFDPGAAKAVLAAVLDEVGLRADQEAFSDAQLSLLVDALRARPEARRALRKLGRALGRVSLIEMPEPAEPSPSATAAKSEEQTEAAQKKAPDKAPKKKNPDKAPKKEAPDKAPKKKTPEQPADASPPETAAVERPHRDDAATRPQGEAPRSRAAVWAAGGVLAALIMLGAWLVLSPGSSTKDANSTPDDVVTVSAAPPAPVIVPSADALDTPVAEAVPSPFEADLARLIAAAQATDGLASLPPGWLTLLPAQAYAEKHDGWLAGRTSTTRLRAEGTVLTTMGLLPPQYAYVETMERLMQQGAVQYFDDRDGLVYRSDEAGDDVPLPIRELVYQLQYRHLNLAQRLDPARIGPTGDDHGLAAMALLQGHAFSVYVDAALGSGTFLDGDRGLQVLGEAEESLTYSEEFSALPEFLRRIILFPEIDGARYVHARLAIAPPEHVDALFTRLPTSSQEILHPENDFAADPPLRIELDLPAKQLGVNEEELAYDGVLGELGLGMWLELVGRDADAAELVTGWDGDRLWMFPSGRKVMLLHVSVWDDVASAERFESAVDALFQQRYGGDRRRRSALARQGEVVAWLEGIIPGKGAAPAALQHVLARVKTARVPQAAP